MRWYTKPLIYCPSCDAGLPKAIWPGEEWDCLACGEYGTHRAGGYSDAPLVPMFPERPATLGPAQGDDDGLPF